MMAAPSWMLTGCGGWVIHPQALPGWEKRMMVHHLQALTLPQRGKADTKSWFSTPALPGQLSTAGGWGLYFLDKLGVLACGDFWPWVGWGAVITLAVFLAVLILMIVTSICRPIRSFCTCCCRQTKRWHAEWGSSSLSCKWGVLTSPWISGWHVANCFTGFRPENTFCWRKCHHGPAERRTTGSTMPHQEHPTWKL